MVRLFRVAFTKQAGKFSRSPAIGQTFQGSPETGLSATRHPIFLSKVQKRTGSFSEGIWLQVSKVSEYSWLLTQWSQVVEINHEENLDKGKDLAAKMARYCFYNNTILDLGNCLNKWQYIYIYKYFSKINMFILEWLKWCFRKKEKKKINLENVLDTLLRKTIQNDSKFVIRIYIYTYICLKWRHIKYSNILRVGGKTTRPLIYIYFFFLFLPTPQSMQDLTSPTRHQTHALCRGCTVLTTGLPGKSLGCWYFCLWILLYFWKIRKGTFIAFVVRQKYYLKSDFFPHCASEVGPESRRHRVAL